jgi:hypothetical protein
MEAAKAQNWAVGTEEKPIKEFNIFTCVDTVRSTFYYKYC